MFREAGIELFTYDIAPDFVPLQRRTCLLAARPIIAFVVKAILFQLRGIDTTQTDSLIGELETVPVPDIQGTTDGWNLVPNVFIFGQAG